MAISDNFVPNIQDGGGSALPVPYQELTDSGAVTIASGVVFLNKAGVVTATIADPPTSMDGAILHVISVTAQAHTLSNASGSGYNGGANDLGTFGGATADSISLVAKGGVWYVLNNVNVTLS